MRLTWGSKQSLVLPESRHRLGRYEPVDSVRGSSQNSHKASRSAQRGFSASSERVGYGQRACALGQPPAGAQ